MYIDSDCSGMVGQWFTNKVKSIDLCSYFQSQSFNFLQSENKCRGNLHLPRWRLFFIDFFEDFFKPYRMYFSYITAGVFRELLYLIYLLFVCLGFFNPLENFSLVWRRPLPHYGERLQILTNARHLWSLLVTHILCNTATAL